MTSAIALSCTECSMGWIRPSRSRRVCGDLSHGRDDACRGKLIPFKRPPERMIAPETWAATCAMPPVEDPTIEIVSKRESISKRIPPDLQLVHPQHDAPMELPADLVGDLSRLITAMLLNDMREFPNVSGSKADHPTTSSSTTRFKRGRKPAPERV